MCAPEKNSRIQILKEKTQTQDNPLFGSKNLGDNYQFYSNISKNSQNIWFLPKTEEKTLNSRILLKTQAKNTISGLFKIDGSLQKGTKKAWAMPQYGVHQARYVNMYQARYY